MCLHYSNILWKKRLKKSFNPNEDTKYLYVRTHAKENKAMLPSYIAKWLDSQTNFFSIQFFIHYMYVMSLFFLIQKLFSGVSIWISFDTLFEFFSPDLYSFHFLNFLFFFSLAQTPNLSALNFRIFFFFSPIQN